MPISDCDDVFAEQARGPVLSVRSPLPPYACQLSRRAPHTRPHIGSRHRARLRSRCGGDALNAGPLRGGRSPGGGERELRTELSPA